MSERQQPIAEAILSAEIRKANVHETADAAETQPVAKTEKTFPDLLRFLPGYESFLTADHIAIMHRLQNEFGTIITADTNVLAEILKQIYTIKEIVEHVQTLRTFDKTTLAEIRDLEPNENSKEQLKAKIETKKRNIKTSRLALELLDDNRLEIKEQKDKRIAELKHAPVALQAAFHYHQTQKFLEFLCEAAEKIRQKIEENTRTSRKTQEIDTKQARFKILFKSLMNQK